MNSQFKLVALSLLLLAVSSLSVRAQDPNRFELEKSDGGVAILVDGNLFARYVINEANKPFLYPVMGPSGESITRGYPMVDVEGERKDHPHHRSIWFGHQSIGGFDTWHEKMTLEERAGKKKTKEEREKYLEESLADLGSTVHREFVRLAAERDHAVIVTRNDYVDSSGKKLLADERTFTFRVPDEKTRVIDVDMVFSAPHGPVVMGDKKDSGFSVRVPTILDVDSEKGGVLINSLGDRDKEAWGKRADWCDYHGVMNGKKVGIAILNHPRSWRYPTPWHVRTYGLMTANPFGLQSVAREEKSGEVSLDGEDTITLRHRVIFHLGDHEEAGIQAAWEAYAKE